jgi:hypothetical protein
VSRDQVSARISVLSPELRGRAGVGASRRGAAQPIRYPGSNAGYGTLTPQALARLQSMMSAALASASEANQRFSTATERLQSEWNGSAQAGGTFVREARTLASLILRKNVGLAQDLLALPPKLAWSEGTAAVDGVVGGSVSCAASNTDAISEASTNLGQRFSAWTDALGAATADGVPPEVRTALDQVILDAVTANADLVELRTALTDLHLRLNEPVLALSVGARAVALQAGSGLVWPLCLAGSTLVCEDMAKGGTAELAGVAIWLSTAPEQVAPPLEAFRSRGTDALESQARLAASVSALEAASRNEGGRIAAEIGNIAYTGLDAEVVNAEGERMGGLLDVWMLAATAMPGRIAASVPVLIQQEIGSTRLQIEGRLATMAKSLSNFEACQARQRDAYNLLDDAELTANVASAAVGAVKDQAGDVIADLQALLAPTTSLLPDVEGTLEAGAGLVQLIAVAAQVAGESYATETAADRQEAEDARQCATSTQFALTETASDVSGALDNLVRILDALEGALAAKIP